jgi:hypothetical protein
LFLRESIVVKEIQLTHGKVALVDDSDYEWLNQWKWFAQQDGNVWYARRNQVFNGKHIAIQMHALILSTPHGYHSDHKNGDGLDNQRNNLRYCTAAENTHNQRLQRRNKHSRFKGVTRQKTKWQAQIVVGMKKIYLGVFPDEEDAALAYDNAARKYYREFARTNFKGG